MQSSGQSRRLKVSSPQERLRLRNDYTQRLMRQRYERGHTPEPVAQAAPRDIQIKKRQFFEKIGSGSASKQSNFRGSILCEDNLPANEDFYKGFQQQYPSFRKEFKQDYEPYYKPKVGESKERGQQFENGWKNDRGYQFHKQTQNNQHNREWQCTFERQLTYKEKGSNCLTCGHSLVVVRGRLECQHCANYWQNAYQKNFAERRVNEQKQQMRNNQLHQTYQEQRYSSKYPQRHNQRYAEQYPQRRQQRQGQKYMKRRPQKSRQLLQRRTQRSFQKRRPPQRIQRNTQRQPELKLDAFNSTHSDYSQLIEKYPEKYQSERKQKFTRHQNYAAYERSLDSNRQDSFRQESFRQEPFREESYRQGSKLNRHISTTGIKPRQGSVERPGGKMARNESAYQLNWQDSGSVDIRRSVERRPPKHYKEYKMQEVGRQQSGRQLLQEHETGFGQTKGAYSRPGAYKRLIAPWHKK